jgi:hypothetical protein
VCRLVSTHRRCFKVRRQPTHTATSRRDRHRVRHAHSKRAVAC